MVVGSQDAPSAIRGALAHAQAAVSYWAWRVYSRSRGRHAGALLRVCLSSGRYCVSDGLPLSRTWACTVTEGGTRGILQVVDYHANASDPVLSAALRQQHCLRKTSSLRRLKIFGQYIIFWFQDVPMANGLLTAGCLACFMTLILP